MWCSVDARAFYSFLSGGGGGAEGSLSFANATGKYLAMMK